MFNFSANNLVWISKKEYEKGIVHVFQDTDTKRCYKIYDYSKIMIFEANKKYCVYGKVNSADKIYLVVEKYKEG